MAYEWGSTRVQRLLYEYGADDTIVNEVSNCSNCNYHRNLIVELQKGEKPVDLVNRKLESKSHKLIMLFCT